MATITTEQIKELRDLTGISVMQCKKALEEADGDMEKATLLLKKKSAEIAAKKSDREASCGYISKSEKAGIGILLALKCETDFVAKNADFVTIADSLSKTALDSGKEEAQKVAPELISSGVQKLGENIQLGEIVEIKAPIVGTYVHDGRLGVAVGLSAGTETLAKDIAMHIAAMNPEYKTRADISADETTKVKAMFEEEVNASDKPEEIKEKMLTGKIDTFFKERTLLDQPFIKNPDMTIEKMLKSAGAEILEFKRIAVS